MIEQKRRRRLQHLCLDKAYNSEQEEQELINEDMYCIFLQREKEMKKKNQGYNSLLLKS